MLLCTDYGIERLVKKVVGKAEVEDALKILDLLTKEVNLTMAMAMAMARDLEDTHLFDDEATMVEEIVQDVNGNVKATKLGKPIPFSFFIYVLTLPCHVL